MLKITILSVALLISLANLGFADQCKWDIDRLVTDEVLAKCKPRGLLCITNCVMQELGIANEGVLDPKGLEKFVKKNGFPQEDVDIALDSCGKEWEEKECPRAAKVGSCLLETFCSKEQGDEAKSVLMRRLFKRKN